MISVVCWKWTPASGYRSTFGPETVNTLFRMVRAHYAQPFRAICVTDDPAGIEPSVEVLPLWPDFVNVPSPHGGKNPSCYRRLRMFHPEAGQWFGDRFVWLDLDCVITGDLAPVFNRTEDVVLWGDTNPTTFYNGSMGLLAAGARPRVWTEFDPKQSPVKAKAAGQFGSDQAWISYCLGPKETKWSTRDGVYSYRVHLKAQPRCLPDNARIVMFHGQEDPWGREAQRLPWVRQHYRQAREVAA